MAKPASVLVLYSGGTIGMVKAAGGEYVPEPGFLSAHITACPMFYQRGVPHFTIRELDPLIDSSEIHPGNWSAIATEISQYYDQYDGFVILHGTDTMAYTASALSFLCHGLNKPVVLSGAQIPLGQLRSDGYNNLLGSLQVAGNFPELNEVVVYFNNTLFRGNRVTKIHGTRMAAFDSPNYPPLGEAGIHLRLASANLLDPPATPFHTAALSRQPRIAILPVFPGISAGYLSHFLDQPVDGVILKTYGSGNMPMDPAVLAPIEQACQRDIIVVNCSQCLGGHVDMSQYATGRTLQQSGVVSGKDLTDEAAFTKLHYLCATQSEAAVIRRHMPDNLKGELSQ